MEQLSSEENNILRELYQRITCARSDRAVDEVMQFWNRLNEFEKRQRWYMGLNRSDHIITSTQASRMLDDFKYYELLNDISNETQQKKDGGVYLMWSFIRWQDGNMQL